MDEVTRKIADYWTRHPEQQREKKKTFVEALRQNGNVRYAATLAHVDRRSVYLWRSEDPDFRAAWDAAKEDAVDQVENALYDMASSRKNVVATIFYLKNNRAQYRDRVTIDVLATQREVEDRLSQLASRNGGSKSAKDIIAQALCLPSGEALKPDATKGEPDPPVLQS